MAYTQAQKQQMIANHMKRHHPQMANSSINQVIWNTISNSTAASNSLYTIPSATSKGSWVGSNSITRVRNGITNYVPESHPNPKAASTRDIYDLIANTLYSLQHKPIDDPQYPSLIDLTRLMAGALKIQDGEECLLTLPDGAKLRVEKDGSYKLETDDAKVIYRANRVRDFNPFINASDKLEDFIKYCGTLNVKQDEMLQLPLELFIMWLVLEAAKADQMEEPEQPLIASIKNTTKARCTACGRFMRKILKQKSVGQCSPKCFEIACA